MFHCLPNSDWADGNLAEVAGQLGQMVEHRNLSQPNPDLRGLGRDALYLTQTPRSRRAHRVDTQPHRSATFADHAGVDVTETVGKKSGERLST